MNKLKTEIKLLLVIILALMIGLIYGDFFIRLASAEELHLDFHSTGDCVSFEDGVHTSCSLVFPDGSKSCEYLEFVGHRNSDKSIQIWRDLRVEQNKKAWAERTAELIAYRLNGWKDTLSNWSL